MLKWLIRPDTEKSVHDVEVQRTIVRPGPIIGLAEDENNNDAAASYR